MQDLQAMKLLNPTTRRDQAGSTIASAGLAVALWLIPAAAQDHRAPAPPAAPAHPAAPATTAPTGSGGSAPATTTTPEAPQQHGATGSAPGERGSHQGAAEPGPGGSHGPQGGTHEAGEPSGAAPGHVVGDEHAPGDGHNAAGEHGKGEEQQEQFSIHLPSWIYGALKQIWYSGPAMLSAEGASVPASQVVGQTIPYTYHDHHSGKEYPIHARIAQVGDKRVGEGTKAESVTVSGQEVTLVNPTVTFELEKWFPELLVISLLTALAIGLAAILLTRNLQRIPGKLQMTLEMIFSGLDGFTAGLIGPHYKRYLPLVGTAFIYILIMNLAGLIPGWASPTANINVTAGMALVVVVYVQIEGIRVNGPLGYLKHFMGEPWWLAWLNFPLHIIGEFAKVLSLTIRLFGNIFGEDVVLVILIALAIRFMGGLPMQAPMYLLAMFTSFVQAMVFSILTCVYIATMTSHDHEEHQGHGDDHAHITDTAAHAPATPA
jgi:F-type H+-transporting ATPase subunit a